MGTRPSGLAELLVSHSGWEAFFSDLEGLYFDQWRAASTVEARERLHVKLEVLADLKMEIENAATEERT